MCIHTVKRCGQTPGERTVDHSGSSLCPSWVVRSGSPHHCVSRVAQVCPAVLCEWSSRRTPCDCLQEAPGAGGTKVCSHLGMRKRLFPVLPVKELVIRAAIFDAGGGEKKTLIQLSSVFSLPALVIRKGAIISGPKRPRRCTAPHFPLFVPSFPGTAETLWNQTHWLFRFFLVLFLYYCNSWFYPCFYTFPPRLGEVVELQMIRCTAHRPQVTLQIQVLGWLC